MVRRLFLALVAVALAWAPAAAAADVLRPRGIPCPPGWREVVSHHRLVCDPGTCETGCAPGTTCREVARCLGRVPYYKQGHLAGEREEPVGTCGPGIECKGRCVTQRVCVAEPPDASAPPAAAGEPKQSSFCAIASSDLFPFVAALLAPALLRRRRS